MSKPVIIGGAALYNMDCMEYMRGLPDKAFELAIVDPPYGIDVAKSGNVGGNKLAKAKDYGAKEWDKYAPDFNYFSELKRVSHHQVIWGANHFMDKVSRGSPCWIVWDKDNSGNFADCELAFTSFETAVRIFRYRWNGMLQGDMKNKEVRIHPTQKPIKLYEWLLTNYAKPGDRILDTHLGSGSSAIACLNLGFEIVGCELDADYFAAACKRIRMATAQERLFA
jgi:site-specific DNA-methyltransferase (adenine-specific)